MKTQSTPLFTGLNNHQVQNLMAMVKEILALNFTSPAPKSFTAADLWNIQRRKKTFTTRRFL